MSAPEREPSASGYVASSPVFFRLIRRSMAAFVAAACVLAAVFPAPLQEPADIGKVPNPAKSAWFLLWIQELVSYSRNFIYVVVLLAGVFLALPYTRWGGSDGDTGRPRRIVAALAFAVFSCIVVLTIIAYLFRGKDWALCLSP